MKHRITVIITLLAALSIAAIMASSSLAAPVFLDGANLDYTSGDSAVVTDPGIPAYGLGGAGDVLVWRGPTAGGYSGWDVERIHFEYDRVNDIMHVGIDCVVICGDADGDGDPGSMAGAEGVDTADLAGNESITLLLDTNNDIDNLGGGTFEVVIGVSRYADMSSFGAYHYTGGSVASGRSAGEYGARLSHAILLHNNPSLATPDLEFDIEGFSTLPGASYTPGEPLRFKTFLFAGSRIDIVVTEEMVPGYKLAAEVVIGSEKNGCTPGYWQQKQHWDSWVRYNPSDNFDATFGVTFFGRATLLDAVMFDGGAELAMARHAVAALLNTSNEGVDYLYSTDDVFEMVQSAFAEGRYEATKDMFATQNELGCELN